MGIHPEFPKNPYEIAPVATRWSPSENLFEDLKLRAPLVQHIRTGVEAWRDSGYAGASETTRALLRWWFEHEHIAENGAAFRYYFAQREAVETAIWLYEVKEARDKYELMRFDAFGGVSANMFDEEWTRYVLKLATGSGKTKVMSLIIVWSYFNRLYENNADLSKNFLLIAPNIIVLDRLKSDFEGLKIFFADPALPDNGHEGQNWREDFQLNFHLQDEIGHISAHGNLFLTNIHRIYEGSDGEPSFEDEDTTEYFLGSKPVTKTTDRNIVLGDIVRDIDELMVLNDEAHHIHDESLAWFRSIRELDNRLRLKGKRLSLQLDVTATPKHNNGAIFVQTVSDYPLVEAIYQGVVKTPVIPDEVSRAALAEKQSSKFCEQYEDFLHLGYVEWKESFEAHGAEGKKAVYFVMTDNTKNCDEVAEFLSSRYPELEGKVLTIHTNRSGEISEATSGKSKEELEKLRKEANEIDSTGNKYRAIVSVLMLKEGWDTKNVTVICGLRSYSATSNILPEQTLGRGLRLMYGANSGTHEQVSILGTPAFMDFVESIKKEGVTLEKKPMGGSKQPRNFVVEPDKEKPNADELDIEIPILSPKFYREYKNLQNLSVESLPCKSIEPKKFSENETKVVTFIDVIEGDISHKTEFDTSNIDYRNVMGYFTRNIMREARLTSGYDTLYPLVKGYIKEKLFGVTVDLEDKNILRNLSEPLAKKTIFDAFVSAINELTTVHKSEAKIEKRIKLKDAKPQTVQEQGYLIPKKSLFNKIIGDSGFELEFAAFLDKASDVVSFAKNSMAVGFKMEYVKTSGEISFYFPDFLVKTADGKVWVVETKGREDLNDLEKIKRLQTWVDDVNKADGAQNYASLYVKQEEWEKHSFKNFDELSQIFNK